MSVKSKNFFDERFRSFMAAQYGVADPKQLPDSQRLAIEDAYYAGALTGFYHGLRCEDQKGQAAVLAMSRPAVRPDGRFKMTAPTRPPLRWHGGKWRLAPWIISHFPKHTCYVEPYGGGASVLLRKERANLDVYNDLDKSVVTLFRLLRDDPDELIRRVEMTPFSRDDFDLAQDFARPVADDLDLCLRLLVRSHMGFSSAGTCGRGNQEKTGFRGRGVKSGTTPPENWRRFPPILNQVAERMRGVVIENRPALDLIEAHDAEDTLFYVDPPYLPETRDARADYNHEMTAQDHDELLARLSRVTGQVILSGYPSEAYDDALPNWHRAERQTMADGARPRTEVLWMNFRNDLPLFENMGAA